MGAVLFVAGANAQETITLNWDPSPDATVVGYRAYFGTASGSYDHQLDAGNTTTIDITGLNDQVDYFFVVTAYDANGLESEPTNEVTSNDDVSPTPTPVPTIPPIIPPPPVPQLDPLMQGALDQVNQQSIGGWAYFSDQPNTPISVDIYIDGLYYTTTVANVFRDDLLQAGIGNGQHGFRIPTPPSIMDGQIHIVATLVGVQAAIVASPASNPTPTPDPDRKSLLNVSVRGYVQPGDNAMIGGFIVTGDVPKKVVLRGLGPSLANAGVANALSDPLLDLYDSAGNLVYENNDWRSDSQNAGLDPGLMPSDERESVISITLSPGSYSAVLKGADDGSGIALFEIYDLDPGSARLANLSSRGNVGNGDSAIIAGVIIGGEETTTVMLRAIGPSLANSGVANPLPDPVLELHDQNGSLIFQNDNWRSDQEQQIIDSGIAPSDDRECAIIATLAPGSYSAVVYGSGGSTGIGLAEIYNLDN